MYVQNYSVSKSNVRQQRRYHLGARSPRREYTYEGERLMSLWKIKNPVEYSFFQWMNNFPDSTHWADKARFYSFVKTVCRYNAVKWKSLDFLRNKILDKNPHFDSEYLEHLIRLYDELIKFYKVQPISTGFQLSDREIKMATILKSR